MVTLIAYLLKQLTISVKQQDFFPPWIDDEYEILFLQEASKQRHHVV